MVMTKPATRRRILLRPGPLYPSRTFVFDPDDTRKSRVSVSFKVVGDWEMNGPKGTRLAFPAGTYTLEFPRHSPQPLVRLTIDPDPGGGRVP